MPILNCKSTFGNFGWVASVEVTQEQALILASKGLLQILQRSPASEAEKILAGYEKRPKDFERKDIPFNEANARTLEKHLGSEQEVDIDDDTTFKFSATVKAEYHEIGGGKELVYKDAKLVIARHVKDGDFAQWMETVVSVKGVTAADAEKPEVLQAVHAMLKAEYAKRLAAL